MAAAFWIGLALAIAAAVQALMVRRDRDRHPPPGRFIDGLHVLEIGAGGPAVVFEAGLAATCLNWHGVQRALAPSRRTVSYDRAGLGWSAAREPSRSLRAITDDLHAVIHGLGVARPVVLTGHSFGTLIVRAYAHRFPEDVAGLVLVDPVMPSELTGTDTGRRLRLWRARVFSRITGAAARIGLVRLGLWGLLRRGPGNPGPLLGLHATLRRIAAELGKLPEDIIPPLRARWSEPRFFRELAASIHALPACAAEAALYPIPVGLPVIVLSGAHQPPDLLAAHRALATRHVLVEGSAHWIHLDQPSLVADAVLSIGRAGSD